jgi:thiol-disulfide isomerase/thioredoxin
MKQKIKKYLIEFIKLVVIIAIVLNIVSFYKSQSLNKEKLTISNFELLDNNLYIPPTDKPILVHFWTTWCPICTVEAPNIDFISEHFEVITIVVQANSQKEIEEYMQKHSLNFKVVDDHDGAFAKHFEISVYPTTFIYNKDKSLSMSEVGYTSTLGLYLRMLWASL